ncbi:MAG: 7-cyano-7-deazaguanine synthase QueC [Methanobacteriaceae archaeon]|jgi:7-cyano-7-deazaguanine synthase|nr:7-cyano-7-deazaguanine synthase QueC [Candidatus Methanorudis spinitermitis]
MKKIILKKGEIISNKPKAISIFSGGLDSTVATVKFIKTHEIHVLTFDYGQKSVKEEIKSSEEICKKLDLEHSILDLKWLADLGNSALTTETEIPELNIDDLDNKKKLESFSDKVWVPGRNLVFTSIATSFAEAEGAEIIIVGWDKEEATNFPDNSKKFLNSFNETINIGSKDNVKIKAPLIEFNKKKIVELGKKLKAPMELSYSCYQGGNIHCGRCESCLRRKRAFIKAGIEDKTIYIK